MLKAAASSSKLLASPSSSLKGCASKVFNTTIKLDVKFCHLVGATVREAGLQKYSCKLHKVL
uniref:Uncharacterized protein MANES_04G156400 n=1 Tax=Rhizophora mucronata TaxID=61149 RepID=A0A2P2M6E8_RHIMU